MKIGLNATCLNERPSGAKQRFVGIYGSLFRRLPSVEFVVYEPNDCQVAGWFSDHPNVFVRKTPIPSVGRVGKFFAGVSYWREAFRRERFDLFEAMHLPLVRPKLGVSLLTVHDVRGLHARERPFYRSLFSCVLKHSLQTADSVVTVSQTMRKEIIDFFPHTPVSVVYNGIDVDSFVGINQIECDWFLQKNRIPREYILAVGHIEPRKNYVRLIEAIALLRDRGFDCPLVIIGNNSGESEVLLRLIRKLSLNNRVILLSGLSDTEVRCAYLCCHLFVFPSTYEGFGIPILEAMAAKRPMALSNIPVFNEITGGQSVYFSPDDVGSMADSIGLALASNDIREDMVQYGKSRVHDFSLDRLANEMTSVYNNALM